MLTNEEVIEKIKTGELSQNEEILDIFKQKTIKDVVFIIESLEDSGFIDKDEVYDNDEIYENEESDMDYINSFKVIENVKTKGSHRHPFHHKKRW